MKKLALVTVVVLVLSSKTPAGQISEIEREIVDLVAGVRHSIVAVAAVSHYHGGHKVPFTSRSKAVGCGVVLDSQGHILTTATVVGRANEVEITTSDGDTLRGVVLGTDRVADIAVIKADNEHLKPATFAEEDEIPPGSLAFVVGNAFGVLPSVAMGVVSGLERSAGEEISSLRLAVPISPGDIGGPVLNSEGKVIGIVLGRLTLESTYRAAPTSTGGPFAFRSFSQPTNMAVAIPTQRVREISKQIITSGSIKRGYLGVRVLDLTDDLRNQLGDMDLNGVVVVEVVKGSPAESIGIRPGDVITDFDSIPIASVESLRNEVLKTQPGDVVEIGFRRGADTRSEKVRIGDRTPRYLNLGRLRVGESEAEILRTRLDDLRAQIRQLEEQLKKLRRP